MLNIGGMLVGIKGLEQIFAEVKALGLADESEIRRELFERVKQHNYVAHNAEDDYRLALWQEYQRR